MKRPTVAAISSHVMRGTVGLRAITFALERRGASVWSVPTVILPWHPGMGPSTRAPSSLLPQQLGELSAHAAAVDAVLTGYFVAAEQVVAAARFIDAVKAARPDALIVVDPIAGDENGRYVSDAVFEAIAAKLLPRADIATPNINELKEFTGAATVEAARRLGPPKVLVSSAVLDETMIGAWLVEPDRATLITHPRLPNPARGTGDLFSGVFTSALLAERDAVAAAVTASAATLAAVCGSGSEALDLGANEAAIAAPDLPPVVTRPL